MLSFSDSDLPPKCSRAGCKNTAEWNVNWRNPKLHGVERVKVWLACGEHVEFLRDYLATRGFPVSVTEFGQSVATVEEGLE